MNNGQNQLQINDIKTIVEIPDYSIYIYYGLIFFCIAICIALIYFIYSYFRTKKISKEKEYFNILKNVNFSKQKQTAYTVSKYGALLIKEERQQRLFEELYQSFEEFKYKKTIDKEIPKSVKLQYELFVESLDVR